MQNIDEDIVRIIKLIGSSNSLDDVSILLSGDGSELSRALVDAIARKTALDAKSLFVFAKQIGRLRETASTSEQSPARISFLHKKKPEVLQKVLTTAVDELVTLLRELNKAREIDLVSQVLILLGRMFLMDDLRWGYKLAETDSVTMADSVILLSDADNLQLSSSEIGYVIMELLEARELQEGTRSALETIMRAANQ